MFVNYKNVSFFLFLYKIFLQPCLNLIPNGSRNDYDYFREKGTSWPVSLVNLDVTENNEEGSLYHMHAAHGIL